MSRDYESRLSVFQRSADVIVEETSNAIVVAGNDGHRAIAAALFGVVKMLGEVAQAGAAIADALDRSNGR